jgi:hypothetical protein
MPVDQEYDRWRRLKRHGLALGAGATIVAAGLAVGAAASGPRAPSKTIGLVVTSWHNALVETPNAQECANGLQPGEVAQFKADAPAQDNLRRFGGSFENRGPNGETGNFSPMTVADKLPFHELITKDGFGVNLDGTRDGRATGKTCRHDKFTNAEGEQVDNQLARVIGCVMGYRKGGQSSEFYSEEVINSAINRHLIEISGVDDETNDPAVEVRVYKGLDRLVRGGDGKFVAGLSQRVDERFPKYMFSLRGRIENGVLITEPAPNAVLPVMSERNIGDRVMRDTVLRLKLTPDGAEGLLAGYDNWRYWYNIHSKRVVAELSKFSSPSIYRAFERYADGYPDPKTGQCSFISATYRVTAVRAIIVHPSQSNANLARN